MSCNQTIFTSSWIAGHFDDLFLLFQSIRAELEKHRSSLEADIARGRSLLADENAPVFVQEALNALTDSVAETNQLAEWKYQALKVRVHS